MSQSDGQWGSKSPLHESFNSCALALTIKRETPFSANELDRLARVLMREIAESTLKAGAMDIGHIKGVFETGGGLVYASTLGDPGDISVRGKTADGFSEIKMTLNSVVLGLGQASALAAAQAAVETVAKSFQAKLYEGKEH